MLAVPEGPPPNLLPGLWTPAGRFRPVVIIKVFIFLVILGFALAVLDTGADLVVAGTFVSVVVVAAAKAVIGLVGTEV